MPLGIKTGPTLGVTNWNQRNKDVEFICRENDSGERYRAIMGLLFSFWLLWQPELWVEFNLLNTFGRASPKEYPCQVSSRLAQWFRRSLKKLLMMHAAQGTPDIGRSQKLTMSTLCSGELQKMVFGQKV